MSRAAHFFVPSSVPVFVPVSGALSVGGGTYVTAGVGIGLEEDTVGGQAKFGPEISYRGAFVNGVVIEPFAAIEGIWTFSEEGTDDLVVDTLAGNNELRGKVGAGIKAVTAGGTTLAISGSYDAPEPDRFTWKRELRPSET